MISSYLGPEKGRYFSVQVGSKTKPTLGTQLAEYD